VMAGIVNFIARPLAQVSTQIAFYNAETDFSEVIQSVYVYSRYCAQIASLLGAHSFYTSSRTSSSPGVFGMPRIFTWVLARMQSTVLVRNFYAYVWQRAFDCFIGWLG